MRRAVLIFCLAAMAPALPAAAQPLDPDYGAIIDRSVNGFILPGFARLSAATSDLNDATGQCGGDEARLRAVYHAAFDAWIGVSHIRLGPSEDNNAAFAIAFWPDPKGFTAKSLSRLISDRDPVVKDPEAFHEVSIASRGLFALERLLFQQTFRDPADGYRCALVNAITLDLKQLSAAIEAGWRDSFADQLRGGGDANRFSDDKEAVRALYSAMKTGAEFTLTARLDRPLGSNERPRPKRAEAWRSDRSNRNIGLSIAALAKMFETAFAPDIPKEVADAIRSELHLVQARAEALSKPLPEEVVDPLGRGRVTTLRFSIEELVEQFEGLLRPSLGLSLSFNTLDGD